MDQLERDLFVDLGARSMSRTPPAVRACTVTSVIRGSVCSTPPRRALVDLAFGDFGDLVHSVGLAVQDGFIGQSPVCT